MQLYLELGIILLLLSQLGKNKNTLLTGIVTLAEKLATFQEAPIF